MNRYLEPPEDDRKAQCVDCGVWFDTHYGEIEDVQEEYDMEYGCFILQGICLDCKDKE